MLRKVGRGGEKPNLAAARALCPRSPAAVIGGAGKKKSRQARFEKKTKGGEVVSGEGGVRVLCVLCARCGVGVVGLWGVVCACGCV